MPFIQANQQQVSELCVKIEMSVGLSSLKSLVPSLDFFLSHKPLFTRCFDPQGPKLGG